MKALQLINILKTSVPNRFNILLQSSPGFGKSDIVAQTAKSLNYDLMLSHPTVSDAVDYKGLPAIVNGNAQFLPYGDLELLMTTKNNLLCAFEDLGNSSPMVQASLLQIILAREINGKKISDKVSFVACTNRRQDSTGVSGLIKALVSRFHMIIELEADPESWKQWALNNNVPIELIAFINFRPLLLSNFDPKDKNINNFACPRTITNLGKLINAGIIDLECWRGCVGEAFSVEFMAFYKMFKILAKLPNEVILNPDNAIIPQKQDELFALIGALVHKSTETNIDNILKYMERGIAPEFQSYFIKDVQMKSPKVMETRAMITHLAKYPELVQ